MMLSSVHTDTGTIFQTERGEITLLYPDPCQPHYLTLHEDTAFAWLSLRDALGYVEADGLTIACDRPAHATFTIVEE
jgi:hypothetical protein